MPLPVTWHLDTLAFNTGPDSDGCEYYIGAEKGWSGAPATRSTAPERTHGPGGYPGTTWPHAREIELSGFVVATTPAARRRAEHRLAALAQDPTKLYELTCTEETGALIARVQRSDATEVTIQPGGLALDFTLTLTAPDPRKYGPENHATTTLPSDGHGLVFDGGLDFAHGLDFGPQTHPGTASVTNWGTAPTEPRFVLTGPLDPPVTITRADTAAHCTYLDPIPAHDQVLIDTATRTVTAHRGNHRDRLDLTDWDTLTIPATPTPGPTTVDYALSHTGPRHPAASLTVLWRCAWH